MISKYIHSKMPLINGLSNIKGDVPIIRTKLRTPPGVGQRGNRWFYDQPISEYNVGDFRMTNDGSVSIYTGSQFNDIASMRGERGDTGDVGIAGADGQDSVGAAGSRGGEGTAGAAGPPGYTTVIDSSASPAVVDTSQYAMDFNFQMRKYANGQWNDYQTLIGKKGVAGKDGTATQGNAGPLGEGGPLGNQGPKGADKAGAAGAQGARGGSGPRTRPPQEMALFYSEIEYIVVKNRAYSLITTDSNVTKPDRAVKRADNIGPYGLETFPHLLTVPRIDKATFIGDGVFINVAFNFVAIGEDESNTLVLLNKGFDPSEGVFQIIRTIDENQDSIFSIIYHSHLDNEIAIMSLQDDLECLLSVRFTLENGTLRVMGTISAHDYYARASTQSFDARYNNILSDVTELVTIPHTLSPSSQYFYTSNPTDLSDWEKDALLSFFVTNQLT